MSTIINAIKNAYTEWINSKYSSDTTFCVSVVGKKDVWMADVEKYIPCLNLRIKARCAIEAREKLLTVMNMNGEKYLGFYDVIEDVIIDEFFDYESSVEESNDIVAKITPDEWNNIFTEFNKTIQKESDYSWWFTDIGNDTDIIYIN